MSGRYVIERPVSLEQAVAMDAYPPKLQRWLISVQFQTEDGCRGGVTGHLGDPGEAPPFPGFTGVGDWISCHTPPKAKIVNLTLDRVWVNAREPDVVF